MQAGTTESQHEMIEHRDRGVTVKLPYGRKSLNLNLPRNKNVRLLTPKGSRPIPNPKKYARDRISEYFRSNKQLLLKLKGKKACVVVSDNTRYAFNDILIPILLKELENLGIAAKEITILVANGLHAPMSREDLIENMGKEIVDNYAIENHDANGELVLCGTTTKGTPVSVNRHIMESDLRIATGTTVPHFHAGFGGGFKSILPGITGQVTTLKNHSFNMVSHDRARYGITDGNPIYEDIVEAGLMCGLHFIVNTSVDSEKRMTRLFVGEPRPTHEEAARAVTEDMKVNFSEPFDILVTTNGGFPLDRNLYQCVKGVAVGELMVKKGGKIIVASECRDGVAHDTFQEYMSFGETANDVLDKLKTDESVEDQDNIQILARAMTRAEIIIVTEGVDPKIIRQMKMQYAPSVEEALRFCGWSERADLTLAIVPGGPYVLPVQV